MSSAGPTGRRLLPALPALAGGLAVVLQRRQMQHRAEEIARACHEIRGPLTAVGLATHAAARRGSAVAPAVVDAELWRAARAIEDLGAAGGLRGGEGSRRPREQVQPVDLLDLLQRQGELWRQVGEARGRVVHAPTHVGLPAGARAWVRADPVRLAQAIANLIANALDHGCGDVDLVLRASGERVRVEVSDAGPGLPAPVEVLVARPRGGRGARGRGLAIVSEIARRSGGELRLAPSARGARLVLDLPAERRAPRSLAAGAAEIA